MDFNLKNKPAIQAMDVEFTAGLQKLPYATPVLQLYGSVCELTQGSGGTSLDGSFATKSQQSDRSLKENIVRIDDHPLGIGLYLFDFKEEYRPLWGSDRQFGVMADEVETVMPEAVCEHPDGYKMVNYAMLGIQRSVH